MGLFNVRLGGRDGLRVGDVELEDRDEALQGSAMRGPDLGQGLFAFFHAAGAKDNVVIWRCLGQADDGFEANAAVGSWREEIEGQDEYLANGRLD